MTSSPALTSRTTGEFDRPNISLKESVSRSIAGTLRDRGFASFWAFVSPTRVSPWKMPMRYFPGGIPDPFAGDLEGSGRLVERRHERLARAERHAVGVLWVCVSQRK